LLAFFAAVRLNEASERGFRVRVLLLRLLVLSDGPRNAAGRFWGFAMARMSS
jgi:hypothetical protein